MTYIEFFDKTAAKNICACLTYVPDRVIYIGDNSALMKRHIANYKKVFSDRGHNIEFIFKTASKSNLNSAVKLLSDIVETYDDCVFDITGGEEILTLALGVVYSRYPDKNIQIHKINIKNNTVYDCDKDGTTIYRDSPSLTVEENVKIYGGNVVYGTINDTKTCKWDLNEEFLSDVELIWNVCKGNTRLWNMQIGIFEAAVDAGVLSEDGLTVTVSLAVLERTLAQRRAKNKPSKGITAYLLKYGLLTRFDDDGNTLTLSFKNNQVKKCLTKAGLALEMKVFVTAKAVIDKDGTPVYNDALNGVVIDWDGESHDEGAETLYDTENEIDVLLMHNMVPIFVSCKNGVVSSDELYKLDAVAERFGGQYAKKVLVATSIDSLGEAGKYLRQRAKDMGIKIIENIQDSDDAELAKKIKNLRND